MQIISGIGLPLTDEHVLDTDPVLAPELPGVWLRRLNAFPGRAVAATALTAEQEARSGRSRLRGQSVSPGVVRGLGVTLEIGSAGAAAGEAILQVAPGFGLARSGEDISVPTPRRLRVADLPVYVRADWLDAVAAGASPAGAPQVAPASGGAFAGLTGALPRRLAPRFGGLIGSVVDGLLPRAAVLVAEPVTAELVGRADPADPCPRDPRNDPYDDWRRIDGCRLALYLWPSDIVAPAGAPAPDYRLPEAGPAFRNRLAWRIFDIEAMFRGDDMHPWEAVGVPLALLGFAADWSPLFADRSTALRLGGLPNPRRSAVAQGGNAFLWQARLSQFVEQLGDLGLSVTPEALALAVREMPPVGLLPATALDVTTGRQSLFPAGFSMSAVPIATEQLDLALRQSASLAPFNLGVPDTVELLVPVPERVYEPGLLRTDIIDPLFARTVARFVSDRTMWLVHRDMVRRRRDTLTGALSGAPGAWRASDPDEIDAERLAAPTQRPPVSATRFRRVTTTGQSWEHQFTGAQVGLPVQTGDEIFVWVRTLPDRQPTGLALGAATQTAAGTEDWSRAVYWGDRSSLPQFSADPDSQPRRAGDLPPPGIWTRISRLANSAWDMNAGTLAGVTLDGAQFTQSGGVVEWGPVGKLDQAGNESVWIADEGPAGASLAIQDATATIAWIDADPVDEQAFEDDFGTLRIGDSRISGALQDFRDRWQMAFLAEDFATLDDSGLDGFISALTSRLQATNDALDLGFTRARSDIYRVRQYVLGADAASRLVTSPTLADIAVRDESARAKSDQIRDFVTAAYVTEPSRDPANPMLPVPTSPAGVQRPAVTPTRSALFSRSLSSTTLLRAQMLRRNVGDFADELPANTALRSGVVRPFASALAADERVSLVQPRSDMVARSQLFGSLLATRVAQPTFSISDVQSQLPLPGFAERSAAVGERLTEPPALEAYRYALDGKQTVLASLSRLIQTPTTPDAAGRLHRAGIGMADLTLPGLAAVDAAGAAKPVTLGDFTANPAGFVDTDTLTGDVSKRHESDYFTAAVSATDNAIAMMRLAEGRVDLCTRLLGDARSVRDDIAGRIAQTDPRLRSIEAQLAESRHDVAATTALLAEEQSRVAAVNARRTAVLKRHVGFLAYRRPRTVDRQTVVPISPADAEVAEDPVAICLRTHAFVPDELRVMAGLFRDAPLRWLPPLWPHLNLLDTVESVQRTADTVSRRAPSVLPFLQQELPAVPPGGATRYLFAATAALGAQRATLLQERTVAMQFDRGAFAQLALNAARQRLLDLASPGDLLDGAHARAELGRRTGLEMERIAEVAGCLYAEFGDVLPALRIAWAELLVGLDGTVALQSLAALPRWSELPAAQRRTQQGLADWLFGRVDPANAAAMAAMSDLVRVAALMACHAPVDQIVGAAVARAAPARPGGMIDLSVDLSQVRVGMSVLVRDRAGALLARAVVEDIGGGVARARIAQAPDATVTITSASRVHLTHALPALM